METESGVDTSPHAKVLPTLDGWGLLSIAALCGGIWAFGALPEKGTLSTVPTALVLVLGGWLPFWRALILTPWAEPLALWRTWEREEALPHWPYLQPGTPGATLHQTLRRARAWWRLSGQKTLAEPLRTAALAFIISVLTAMIVGRRALQLTLLMVTWTELAVLWHEGRGDVGPLWAAGGLVGLPWLLGASLGDPEMGQALLSASILSVLVGLYAQPSALAACGPLVAACFLIWQKHYVAAGGILLLALPGWLAILYRPAVHDYRRTVLPWLLGMLAVMAWVL